MRWVVSIGALAAAVACTSDPAPRHERQAEAIVSGTDDDGDDGVVALLAAGSVYCTGTLVSERVILTAAHCIDSVVPQEIFFGPDVSAAGTRIEVIDRHVHPEFDPLTFDNDVGMVLLATAAPSNAIPWPLRTLPLDASSVGAAIRLVGYGDTGIGNNESGRKRQGTSTIDALEELTFTFKPNPSQTCIGDSGGPAFMTDDGTERLVGITSTGDPSCDTFARDRRVDVYADFIGTYLDATQPGSGGIGDRCFYPGSCAAGTCIQPADGLAYCSDACTTDDDCPPAMNCSPSADCRYDVAPGALGSSCVGGNGCATGECAVPECGSDRVCTRGCVIDADCPSDFACDPRAEGSTNACFRSAGGGCSSGGRGGSVLVLLLGMSLALGCWRRGCARRRCTHR